jgi:hypothetical protein
MRISKIKTQKDKRPVLRPNLSERCNRGRYSDRFKWSRESARCRLSLASAIKEDSARADETCSHKRAMCVDQHGSRMNQKGIPGSRRVHLVIPKRTVSANPTETTIYSIGSRAKQSSKREMNMGVRMLCCIKKHFTSLHCVMR